MARRRGTYNEDLSIADDVKQCISTISNTQKGSIPFKPDFGCDIFPAIGEKSPMAIDYLIGVYSSEIPKQEQRCEVVEVTGEHTENGLIKIIIHYALKKSNEADFIEVYV